MTSKAYPSEHPDIGTELVREWAPEGVAKATAVLVHGIAEHSGRYERTGRLLAEAGYHVRSFDLIGAGGSGGRRWDIDEWDRYHSQIGDHVQWAKEQGGPVALFGHSMGGNLSLGYVLDRPIKPDLLILSAPALAGGAAWQRKLAPLAAGLAPKLVMANGVKGEQLSRDPQVGIDYFSDPLVIPKSTARLGAQLFAAIDELNERYRELDIPTLVIHGGEDVLVATASSEKLAELVCVERKVYAGLRHEILNEPEGPQVVADVIAWLDTKLKPS